MINTNRSITAPPVPYDHWLIFAVLSLIAIGLLMVASSSIVISEQHMHQPFYYLFRQIFGLLLGMIAGSIIIQFDIAFWEKIDGILLMGILLLLSLVLLPGIGHAVNGSARWIGVGPLRFQVSEIAKLVMIIYMAGYLYRRNTEIKTQLSGFLKPMGILTVIALLLLREPDFGATVVIVCTVMGMMFLAGMRLKHFLLLVLLVLVALTLIAIAEPYRLQRLVGFLDPWKNPFNSGYQLTQSLIAFGRGGWLGVGLGKSIQKLFYLPEAHTDFLFAVIAEEWGLIGILIIISLFAFIVVRAFLIGRQAQLLKHHFAGYLAYGFGLWIAIQFMVSVGVNSGILPTKGLTLPLVSYGGSSLVINCIMMALLLRIDYENRMMMLGLRDGST